MEVSDLSLPGLKLIQLKIFRDDRGFFMERYQRERFKAHGIPQEMIQDNHSRSKPGVIRGLHYQHSPSQGKLVGVLRGRILDVVVDLRRESPTFGKWESVELDDQNGRLLWVPPGFAHGFCVTSLEDADVFYKVDAVYSPSTEGGIRYDDPDLRISWPVSDPAVSAKDRVLSSWQDYRRAPVF